MAAVFDWESDHGTQTGSPLQGTTRATGRVDINLKNIDDATTLYSSPSASITAGNNSFTTYLFAKFSGSYTSIFGGLFAHTAGTLGTGLTLKSTVTSTYATPAATTNSALTTDITSTTVIASGAAVLFTGTGPQTASPTSRRRQTRLTHNTFLYSYRQVVRLPAATQVRTF
jgi:hypothetical protein